VPGAAFAALCLAGALRRASPFRLALPPAVLWGVALAPPFYTTGYEWRGSEKSAIWGGVDVASDNPHDCNHRGLARAPRRGLPGPRPQAQPTRFASRAVRRSPVSRVFPSPGRKPPRRYEAAAGAVLRLAGAFAPGFGLALPCMSCGGAGAWRGGDRPAFRRDPSFSRAPVPTMG